MVFNSELEVREIEQDGVLSRNLCSESNLGGDGNMEKTLLNHARDARIEDMQIQLHNLKEKINVIWSKHTELCEQASQELQRIAKLEVELEKLKERC